MGTAASVIYTLSLHDALPICAAAGPSATTTTSPAPAFSLRRSASSTANSSRSEEHTSELQSHHDLVCRLLLEKKKHTHPTTLARSRRKLQFSSLEGRLLELPR